MLPTLEILDHTCPKESGHYWLLVLNLRDERFEILDSLRTMKDKKLVATANKIIEGISAIWERHYSKSKVQVKKDWPLIDINSSKQDNGLVSSMSSLTIIFFDITNSFVDSLPFPMFSFCAYKKL